MPTATIDEIPAALPFSESEETREKLLKEAAADGNQSTNENSLEEIDEEEDSADEVGRGKPSKKKLFLAFVCFVLCFVLLLAVLCWFFGIGVFAQTKKQTVDRTVKTNNATAAPATEDEKLKMALNLVAKKTPSGSSDNNMPSVVNTNGDSIVSTTQPNKLTDLNEPVVVPDSLSTSNPNSANVAPVITNGDQTRSQNVSLQAQKNTNGSDSGKSNPLNIATQKTESESEPSARSLFFGASKKEKSASSSVVPNIVQTVLGRENLDAGIVSAPIPFGTLLPIRFLGAVFTLRASGGMVRMELTRAISGKNYSYPAGTVLVGTLRASEYKRAFVSVVGLIDPKSGGLVKFEGEVMGGDGASGVTGRRRKIQSAWSRVLAGLREVGASAVNVIGSRRSGGTVVISDSQTRASGVLSQEIGNTSQSGEFIEISAGTNAYVLVTDLPDEVSDESRLAQNKQSATGLSDDELATLFSEGSPDRIRAAMPRMTLEFRRLAEAAVAAMDKQ